MCAATAKSLRGFFAKLPKRESREIKMVVIAAIAKEARSLNKVRIWRGRFAVFGFSDVTCYALLVVGVPTGTFH